MSPRNTPPGTLYWRAMSRVDRRVRAWVATGSPLARQLVQEACRLANSLAYML